MSCNKCKKEMRINKDCKLGLCWNCCKKVSGNCGSVFHNEKKKLILSNKKRELEKLSERIEKHIKQTYNKKINI